MRSLKALGMAFAAAIACALFAGAATAQDNAAARREVDCSRIMDQALDAPAPTSDQLEAARLCQEISRLEQEKEALGRAPGFFRDLIPWSGVMTGLVGLIVGVVFPVIGGIVGYFLTRVLERSGDRRREQERMLKREEHNLNLMNGLGSEQKATKLVSAAALLRRFEDIRGQVSDKSLSDYERKMLTTEMKLIKDAIFSVLCHLDADKDFAKYVADNMISSFGYVLATDKKDDVKARRPRDLETTKGPMADYKLQGAQLTKVFWRYLHGSNVDFYGADLSEASLRDAWLTRAAFYQATLTKTVLRDADLREANFQDAKLEGADLRGADLSGAILTGAEGLETARFDAQTVWDDATKWPDTRRPGQGYAFA